MTSPVSALPAVCEASRFRLLPQDRTSAFVDRARHVSAVEADAPTHRYAVEERVMKGRFEARAKSEIVTGDSAPQVTVVPLIVPRRVATVVDAVAESPAM